RSSGSRWWDAHGPSITAGSSLRVADVPMAVRNIGVMFGGVSPEHEVSVISSLQAAAALDRALYRPIPIYVAKDGTWYTGPELLDPAGYKDLDALLRSAVPVHLAPGSAGSLRIVEANGGWFRKPQSVEID